MRLDELTVGQALPKLAIPMRVIASIVADQTTTALRSADNGATWTGLTLPGVAAIASPLGATVGVLAAVVVFGLLAAKLGIYSGLAFLAGALLAFAWRAAPPHTATI